MADEPKKKQTLSRTFTIPAGASTVPLPANTPKNGVPVSSLPFQTPGSPSYETVDRAPSGSWHSISPGPFDFLRNEQIPGIPQAFVDGYVNRLNDDTNYGYGYEFTPEQKAQIQSQWKQGLIDDWNKNSAEQQAEWNARDESAIQGINSTNQRDAYSQTIQGLPGQQAAQLNQYWGTNVAPALKGVNTAAANQITGNRQAEGMIGEAANRYIGTINENQAGRVAATTQANQIDQGYLGQLGAARDQYNAADNQILQNLLREISSTNASNTALADENIGLARSTNSYNTGLANQLRGAADSTNAANSALGGQWTQAAASTNSNQNALLQALRSSANQTNLNQIEALSQYTDEFQRLNAQDQQTYLKYLSETNPLMAELIAQGSNPEYVKNQEDVVARYREQSDPTVTAEERLIAELTRRKFEGDQQSSRLALEDQLARRGLRSGASIIAGQQATAQQLGQDRMLAELGISANAVGRAERGLQGYAGAAATLRNADDAMRQFQDVYAQQDAQRRGNLAGQRANTGLATTAQQGGRVQGIYDARSQTNRDNYARDESVFDAGSITNRDNYGRTESALKGNIGINSDNYARTEGAIGTQLDVSGKNYERLSGANLDKIGVNQDSLGNVDLGVQTGLGVSQTNYGRDKDFINTGIDLNDIAHTRTQGDLDKGDITALSGLNAGLLLPNTIIQNRGSEVGTAQSSANTQLAGFGQFTTAQQGLTTTQIEALMKALGLSGLNQATDLAGV